MRLIGNSQQDCPIKPSEVYKITSWKGASSKKAGGGIRLFKVIGVIREKKLKCYYLIDCSEEQFKIIRSVQIFFVKSRKNY